jgi:hypothetical protein
MTHRPQETEMNQIMRDCQTVYAGGSPSNFQRQVLDDLYGGPCRTSMLECEETGRRVLNGKRRAINQRAGAIVSRGPGLVLVSVLALLPLVMFL